MIRRRKESGLTDGLRILPAVNLLCGIHFLIDPCQSRIKEKSPDLGQGRGPLKINGAALRGWGAGFSGLAVGNNPTIHNWFQSVLRHVRQRDYLFLACAGLFFSGASLSGGTSGTLRSGSIWGTGGGISGSCRFGSLAMVAFLSWSHGKPFDGANISRR